MTAHEPGPPPADGDRPDPTSAEFFDALYAGAPDADPWRFATSRYELDRYATLDAALGDDRFDSCLELGASIGVFTARLAARCTTVDAVELSPVAATAARRRLAGHPSVTVRTDDALAFLRRRPRQRWALVTVCEVGYYFAPDPLAEVLDRVARAARRTVLVSHWTGTSPDHVLHGTEVHAVADRVLSAHGLTAHREPHDGFLLARWDRR
jgi:hypothetical protein